MAARAALRKPLKEHAYHIWQLAAREKRLKAEIKETESVLMKDELKGMRRVLRRLGHISEEGVIQNKGRVACEVRYAETSLRAAW